MRRLVQPGAELPDEPSAILHLAAQATRAVDPAPTAGAAPSPKPRVEAAEPYMCRLADCSHHCSKAAPDADVRAQDAQSEVSPGLPDLHGLGKPKEGQNRVVT